MKRKHKLGIRFPVDRLTTKPIAQKYNLYLVPVKLYSIRS